MLANMFSRTIPLRDEYLRDFDVCFNQHRDRARALSHQYASGVWDYSHYETERGLYSRVDYSHLLDLGQKYCLVTSLTCMFTCMPSRKQRAVQ